MPHRDDDDFDVPPWLVSVYKLFGATDVQARWRAAKLVKSMRAAKTTVAPPSSRNLSKMCPSCKAIQPIAEARCGSCGARMGSKLSANLRRIGLNTPEFVSVSTILAVAMLLIYVRMWVKFPHEAIGGWSGRVLLAAGSNYGPLSLHGEPWRLATSLFLHIGVMHIGFNVIALAQIGPTIEEIFGRGRMIFFFVVTGILASLGSASLHLANSAGASGALMGLVGLAAGWGQRAGGPHGKSARDQMIKWGIYTMGFGLLVGADNVAHGVGFVAGFAIGWLHDPKLIERTKVSATSVAMALVGGLTSAATVAFIFLLVGRAGAAEPTRDEAGYDDNVDVAPVELRAFWAQVDQECPGIRAGHPSPRWAASPLEGLVKMCDKLDEQKAFCKNPDNKRSDAIKKICDAMPP